MFYEVDEQLRSARLQALFRKSWPYALGLAIIALVAALVVWAVQQYRAGQVDRTSVAYADAMKALSDNDLPLAHRRLEAVATTGTPTYRALARMQEAGMSLKSGDTAAAAALEDQAAAATHDPILGDAARLQAAYLLMDTASYDQIYARLQPLTAKDRPFRSLAREALAVERLAVGHTAEAKGDFEVLSLGQDTSETARNRANAALSLLRSGGPGTISAIAKGAVGLTPQAPPQPAAPGAPIDQQAPAGASQ